MRHTISGLVALMFGALSGCVGTVSPADNSTDTSAVVASVTLAPNAISLAAGQSQSLVATRYNAAGAVIEGGTTSWSSSNAAVASVSAAGLVTGVSAGSATITATSGHSSANAAVTVTAAAPPPPPTTRECAAPRAGWLFCDDFEVDRTASYFEYDAAGGSFVRDGTSGRNGGTAMKAHFAVGQVTAGSLKLAFGRTPSSYFRPIDAGTTNYREIYWRFYTRTGQGWTGGTANKLSRATSFVGADWSQAMFAHIWAGSGADTNYLAIDPASGTDTAGNVVTHGYNDFPNMRWLGAVLSRTAVYDPVYIGRWFCIEGHARLNDPGLANGLMEMWVDDQLESQRGGMNWVGRYTTYGINTVMLENYMRQGAWRAEDRYFDDFVVSTQRIGCGA